MNISLMFKSTNWRLLKQKMSEITQLRQEQKRNKGNARSIQLGRSTFLVKNSVFNENARQRGTFCNDFVDITKSPFTVQVKERPAGLKHW